MEFDWLVNDEGETPTPVIIAGTGAIDFPDGMYQIRNYEGSEFSNDSELPVPFNRSEVELYGDGAKVTIAVPVRAIKTPIYQYLSQHFTQIIESKKSGRFSQPMKSNLKYRDGLEVVARSDALKLIQNKFPFSDAQRNIAKLDGIVKDIAPEYHAGRHRDDRDRTSFDERLDTYIRSQKKQL